MSKNTKLIRANRAMNALLKLKMHKRSFSVGVHPWPSSGAYDAPRPSSRLGRGIPHGFFLSHRRRRCSTTFDLGHHSARSKKYIENISPKINQSYLRHWLILWSFQFDLSSLGKLYSDFRPWKEGREFCAATDLLLKLLAFWVTVNSLPGDLHGCPWLNPPHR